MPNHILCIGAHPDDNEVSVGGTAALLRRAGHVVRFISVTDGRRGHFAEEYRLDPEALVGRRLGEARAAAAIIGAEYDCLGFPDGGLYVTPESTEAMVRCIRSFGPPGQGPDLVLCNRPNDYHRDHRYASRLVLDATYMLTVPLMCPETRHLDRMPVFAYWQDTFTEGGAFEPDVLVPIDDTLETKVRMIAEHESQFFEWLPFNQNALDQVPHGGPERLATIREKYMDRAESWLERFRDTAAAQALPEGCRFVEGFQVSEYGRQPSEEERLWLFGVGGPT